MAKDSEDKKKTSNLPDNNESGTESTSSSKPFDVEEAHVKILMIVNDLNQFHSVKSFLIRRGWPTEVVGNLNKAIDYLAAEEPNFVVISMNFQHPKINMLPTLISQTFGCTTVVFAEKNDHVTMGRLSTIKAKYKELSPISGPSLHRKIKMILSDQYEESDPLGGYRTHHKAPESVKVRRFESDKKSSPVIKQTFLGKAQPDNVVLQSSTKQMAVEKLQVELFGGASSEESSEGLSQTQSDSTALGGVHIQKGQKHKSEVSVLKGNSVKGGIIIAKGAKYESSTIVAKGEGTDSHMGMVKGQSSESQVAVAKGEGVDTQVTVAEGEGTESQVTVITDEDTGSSTAIVQEEEGQPLGTVIEKGLDPSQASEGVSLEPTTDGKLTFEKSNLDPEVQYLFEVAKIALDKVTNYAIEPIVELEKSDEMIVIPLSSTEISGYLLLTHGDPNGINKEFARSFVEAMLSELKARNKVVKMLEFVKAAVRPIKFKKFTSEVGGFNYSTVCGRNEASVGFIFGPSIMVPPVMEKENKTKLAIGVGNIDCNKEISFPAYIHLEKNNRYFLYLKQGSRIMSNQKQKIVNNKVDLYIDPTDVEKFKGYVVGNILDKMFAGDKSDSKKTTKKQSTKKKAS